MQSESFLFLIKKDLLKWFRNRTKAEIVGILGEKIPCAPVLTEEELVNDRNVVSRGMILESPHPLGFTYKAVATCIKFSGTPVSFDRLPPELGKDTLDVLRSLGYCDGDIDK
jgi:crotonobetainyl-CoA:carnitine CoA-transferase CaiB-like acyl-CoA transferase